MANSDPPNQAPNAEICRLKQRIEELESLLAAQTQKDDTSSDHNILSSLFNLNPDIIAISRTSDGKFVDINNSFTTKLGYTREEVIGRTFLELNFWETPADQAILRSQLEHTGTIANFSTRLLTKRGQLIHGLLSSNIIDIDETSHILTIIKDVTQSKQIEVEIVQNNQKLRMLNAIIMASAVNASLDKVLEVACHELGQAFAVPQAHVVLFDKDKETVAIVAEYRQGDEIPQLNQVIASENDPTIKHLLQTKAPLITNVSNIHRNTKELHEWLIRHNTGSILLLPLMIDRDLAGGLRLQSPQNRRFMPEEVSLAWSVADQVADAIARAWLNEERYLLSAAVNQAADTIIISDEQGIIRYVNPAYQHITGYSLHEVVGKKSLLTVETDGDLDLHHQIWSTLKAGEIWHGYITNKKRDGSTYSAETTITPIKNETGQIINFVSTQRDVTREMQLETQYRQSQKMEAIGQLTAGIAHDFNNLLMSINGFAELMQLRLPSDSPFQNMAQRIVASGESAASLIRQLLIFSRKQIIEPEILNLNNTVSDIEKMLRRIIGENIELSTHLEPDLWSIKNDPTQLEQIIVNMAVNARDAMPAGGRLIIETRNVLLPDDSPEPTALGPGKFVLLVISDNGIGIPNDILPHIFEPFFTTKEKDRGTGLGLSTVHGIVQQAGGDIQVQSQAGQGTTFRIYFPHVADDQSPQPAAPILEMVPRGTETILLVEDSAAVQELVALTLEAQGYTVLRADNGEDALNTFRNHPTHVELLLTDVVLPHMSGKELADHIKKINPATKIIFTSGYTNEAIAHYGVLDPTTTFLQKPFSPSILAAKVRQTLDSD